MNPSQIARARKCRALLWSWHAIADYLHVSVVTVRCALDPEFKAKTDVGRKAGRTRHKTEAVGEVTARVPEAVIAERDHRLALAPASITAALMGDPPIGRSALDQRKPRLVVSNTEDSECSSA